MRIVLTGGTGFIGKRLAERLVARGDQVTALTRDVTKAQEKLPKNVTVQHWSPDEEGPWMDAIAKADGVVHLAGELVAKRWTASAKKAIEQSRVGSTNLIAKAIEKSPAKPSVFVCASAIGYYGSRSSSETLTETSLPGEGFLSSVTQKWEDAAKQPENAGVRCVQVRIGVVLGDGGALAKMVLPFKFFVGGPIGTGEQVLSWVHVDDVVGIFVLALDRADLHGPINAVAPSAVSQRQFAKTLGKILKRPALFPTPSFAIEAVLGEAAEIVTKGQRVAPTRALELGYGFAHPELEEALRSIP